MLDQSLVVFTRLLGITVFIRIHSPISLRAQELPFASVSRGDKRQNGNKSLPYKTYLPKGLTKNNHVFQCSLVQIKNRYPLSGFFCEKAVETPYGWISCLALTVPTK